MKFRYFTQCYSQIEFGKSYDEDILVNVEGQSYTKSSKEKRYTNYPEKNIVEIGSETTGCRSWDSKQRQSALKRKSKTQISPPLNVKSGTTIPFRNVNMGIQK